MSICEAYESAVEKGIKNICITSHHEPGEVVKGEMKQSLSEENIQNCNSEIAELKKDERINIFSGVELSYTEAEEEDINKFLEKNKFDFVLGTLHYVKGIPFGDHRSKDKLKNMNHARTDYRIFQVAQKSNQYWYV